MSVVHVMAVTRMTKLEKALMDAEMALIEAEGLSDQQETRSAVVEAGLNPLATADAETQEEKDIRLKAVRSIVKARAAADDSSNVFSAAVKRRDKLIDIRDGYVLTSAQSVETALGTLSKDSQKKAVEIAAQIRAAKMIENAKDRKSQMARFRNDLVKLATEAGIKPENIAAVLQS